MAPVTIIKIEMLVGRLLNRLNICYKSFEKHNKYCRRYIQNYSLERQQIIPAFLVILGFGCDLQGRVTSRTNLI